MTGQHVPSAPGRERRKWVVENYDLVSSAKYCKDGVLRPGAWLRSFRGVEEAAWFSRDDLRPFGAMWRQSLRYAISELRSDSGKRSWWAEGPPARERSGAPVS